MAEVKVFSPHSAFGLQIPPPRHTPENIRNVSSSYLHYKRSLDFRMSVTHLKIQCTSTEHIHSSAVTGGKYLNDWSILHRVLQQQVFIL